METQALLFLAYPLIIKNILMLFLYMVCLYTILVLVFVSRSTESRRLDSVLTAEVSSVSISFFLTVFLHYYNKCMIIYIYIY